MTDLFRVSDQHCGACTHWRASTTYSYQGRLCRNPLSPWNDGRILGYDDKKDCEWFEPTKEG